MFKPFPIKNAVGAAKYFTKEDNYYLSEVEAKRMSTWMGEGAKRLGLEGQVDEQTLQNLLEGRLPNGEIIGLQKDGSIKHRAGYDLHFAPPKSVSILVLDGNERQLYKAHIEAVESTLKIIERDCAQAKVYKDGEIHFENTKNLIIARIGHTTSRKLDTQLHEHALIMNATQRDDGKWRALASSKTKDSTVNGFAERVYDQQSYYKVVYSSFLAHKTKQLGYEIENIGKDGLWEIKGVPQEAREIMSKRRVEILEEERKNQYSKEARDFIAQSTRDKKPSHLDVNSLKSGWRAELASVGFSSKLFIENIVKYRDEDTKENNILVSKSAKESVRDAIDYLSHYKVKLEYERVVAKALEFTIGTTTHTDIVRAVNDSVQEKSLIPLDKAESVFVTKELLESEKNIRKLVDSGRNSALNITINKARTELDTTKPSNRLAVDVLQSNDRLAVIDHMGANTQEFAGAVLRVAEQSGKTVHVLSPSSLAAREINQNIKRNPKTLWQWLVAQGKPEIGDSVAGFNYKYRAETQTALGARFRKGKDVIVVDGAQGLGNVDIQDLLQQAEKTKARVILLNDLKAKRSVTAGNPIEVLEQAKIEKHLLNILSEKKRVIVPTLQAVKDDNKRIAIAAKLLADKDDKERNNALLVTGSKSQVKLANREVRKELQNTGKLGTNEYTFSVLNPAGLNSVDSLYANKYKNGMVVRIYEARGYKDWNVARIDKEQNILIMEDKNKRIRFNPKTNKGSFRVFKREELKLAVGDKIQATANMNFLGLKNAEQLIVKEVGKKSAVFIAGSRKHKIPLKYLLDAHLDYNYATTIGKLPKNGPKHIVASIKAYSLDKPTITTLKNKTTESLTVLTNDTDKALKRFGDTPVKVSATETVLNSGYIDRTIDKKTVAEIKSDVEKAIAVLTIKADGSAAEKAVNFALEKITARNAGFTHKHLVEESLVYALETQLGSKTEGVTHEDVMAVIDAKRKSGELVMGRYFNDGTRWTTKEILDLEKSIIADIKSGQNKLEPLMDRKIATEMLKKTNLTQDQKDAAFAIAAGKSRFIIAQGDAGTGKTTMYVQLQKMLNKVEIQALAPTHQAVRELQDRGIKAQTLKSFLIEQQGKDEKFTNKLFILDEASMVDNKDFAEFSKIMIKGEGRSALSGDVAQLIAVGSGKPYEITQRTNSTDITYLRENLRQQTPILKQAVKEVLVGNYSKAFKEIEQSDPGKHIKRSSKNVFFDSLKESIVDKSSLETSKMNLEEAVANDYLTRTTEIRDKTVVIVHAHEDRRHVNSLIRSGLVEQGIIDKNEITVSRLVQKGLTSAEHKNMSSYKLGNVVKLGKTYYEVVANDIGTKSVLLCNEKGEERYFYPEKHADRYNMEVYKHVEQKLATGDSIRLTKTDKERKLYANFEYDVKEVGEDKLLLISKDDGHLLNLNPKQLKDRHWDYAYTITGYGVQGSSKDYVIDYELSHRKNLSNQRSFYVAASRAKQHLIVYTNDRKSLLDRVISNDGNKPAALEVVGKLGDSIPKHSEKQKQETAEPYHHNTQECSSRFIDKDEVERRLAMNASQVVPKILGRPKGKFGGDYQYSYSEVFGGKNDKAEGGSLYVAVSGSNQGSWHCWKNGDAGGMISLIQRRYNLDFKPALEHAVNILGLNKEQLQYMPTKFNHTETRNIASTSEKYLPGNWDRKQQRSVNYARELAKGSLPISGTIAEKYLREHRGISTDLPNSFRFHPAVYSGINKESNPALLVVGKDKNDDVQAVQAIFLNNETANKKDGLALKKQTWGVAAGAPATIGNAENSDKVFVVEGPETAISILEAKPDSEVKITFGKSNFRHVHLATESRKIVLCLDNDIDNEATEKLSKVAANILEEAGKEVLIAKPEEPGKDYNDLIIEQGAEAIKDNIDQAMPYEIYANNELDSENNQPNQEKEIESKIIAELETIEDENALGKVVESLKEGEEKELNLLEKSELDEENAVKETVKQINNEDELLLDISIDEQAESTNFSKDLQKQLGEIEREIY